MKVFANVYRKQTSLTISQHSAKIQQSSEHFMFEINRRTLVLYYIIEENSYLRIIDQISLIWRPRTWVKLVRNGLGYADWSQFKFTQIRRPDDQWFLSSYHLIRSRASTPSMSVKQMHRKLCLHVGLAKHRYGLILRVWRHQGSNISLLIRDCVDISFCSFEKHANWYYFICYVVVQTCIDVSK